MGTLIIILGFAYLVVGLNVALLFLPWMDNGVSSGRVFGRFILTMVLWPLPFVRFALTQSSDPS